MDQESLGSSYHQGDRCEENFLLTFTRRHDSIPMTGLFQFCFKTRLREEGTAKLEVLNSRNITFINT